MKKGHSNLIYMERLRVADQDFIFGHVSVRFNLQYVRVDLSFPEPVGAAELYIVPIYERNLPQVCEQNSASIAVLVNKWDAVQKDSFTIHRYEEQLRSKMAFLPFVPILFISALTGQRVHKILPMINDIYDSRFIRIPTAEMNRMMRNAIGRHPPPQKGGSGIRFLYATQADVDPPTFVFFVNKPEWIHFSYRRYLENQIREEFPFTGTPIRLLFRARSDHRFSERV